jgi:hypothetical protein
VTCAGRCGDGEDAAAAWWVLRVLRASAAGPPAQGPVPLQLVRVPGVERGRQMTAPCETVRGWGLGDEFEPLPIAVLPDAPVAIVEVENLTERPEGVALDGVAAVVADAVTGGGDAFCRGHFDSSRQSARSMRVMSWALRERCSRSAASRTRWCRSRGRRRWMLRASLNAGNRAAEATVGRGVDALGLVGVMGGNVSVADWAGGVGRIGTTGHVGAPLCARPIVGPRQYQCKTTNVKNLEVSYAKYRR